jgi:hypothetical protein
MGREKEKAFLFSEPFGVYRSVDEVLDAIPSEMKEQDGGFRKRGVVLCPLLEREVGSEANKREKDAKHVRESATNNSRLGRLRAASAKVSSGCSSALRFVLTGGGDVHWGDAKLKQQHHSERVPIAKPPSYKNVLVIGVHGWSILGGAFADSEKMSIQFCNLFSLALCHHLSKRTEGARLEMRGVRICQLPLYGHGKIEEDRVEMYMRTLEGHRALVARADLVVFVSHSQGTVVSNFLAHRLLTGGWLDKQRQQMMLVSMAGVHHGPYPDTISDFYKGTQELFSLNHTHKSLASRHLAASRFNLRNGVRMLHVASWMDEVVPLFSAWQHSMHANPNMRRAIYIDQKHRTVHPFLIRLMNILLLFQNESEMAAFSDLLVHISGFFRGSLFGNRDRRMHSELHGEYSIFALAAEWALEGRGIDFSALPSPPGGVSIHSHSFSLLAHMLTDSFIHLDVNRHIIRVRWVELMEHLRLRDSRVQSRWLDLERLRHEFEDWSPKSKPEKALRDELEKAFSMHSRLGVAKL